MGKREEILQTMESSHALIRQMSEEVVVQKSTLPWGGEGKLTFYNRKS